MQEIFDQINNHHVSKKILYILINYFVDFINILSLKRIEMLSK
jgi:hypothetical protein